VQIKVWLLGLSPMVWRRVLVPAACTLRELDGVFQVAMGGRASTSINSVCAPLGTSVECRRAAGSIAASADAFVIRLEALARDAALQRKHGLLSLDFLRSSVIAAGHIGLRRTWDMLAFGLRAGAHPQICITTNAAATRLLKAIMADPRTVVTRGSTFDNRSNLALLDELVRLKLFTVEHRDFVATLVPAESASAKAEPAKTSVTVSGTVSPDLAEQFRDAASRAGTNVSALIASLITEYL
jgi:hypothetical protein